MNAPLDLSALSGTGLSQHARLLTLASAQDSGLLEALIVERIAGREGVNELFAFDVIEPGFYFSLSRPNSRRYFAKGEIAPVFDTQYGKTFWQWDNQQD